MDTGPEQDGGPPRRTSLKRTYDQISRSPPRQISNPLQPAWASRFHQAVQNRSSMTNSRSDPPHHRTPTSPAPRYSGDGFDFRRPVLSQSFGQTRETSSMERRATQEVIDLTSDTPQQSRTSVRRRSHSPVSSRLPSLEYPDIIDLDNLDASESLLGRHFDFTPLHAPRRADTPAVDLTGPTPIDLDDEDVQFISENPVRQRSEGSGSYLRRLAHPRSGSGTGHRRHGHHGTERHPSPWPDAPRRGRPDPRFERLDHSIRLNELAARQTGGLDASYRAARPMRRMFPTLQGIFGDAFGGIELPPLNVDFTQVAFNIHTGQATRPKYEAPPAVAEGFTRSPKQDDVVVCPNCDHELGQGEEKNKQVWAIRECGHVHCGICAGTRKIGNKKSTNVPSDLERPRKQRTLDTCAADGCASKTAGKTKMFQVYI